jgi:hypothetical protein
MYYAGLDPFTGEAVYPSATALIAVPTPHHKTFEALRPQARHDSDEAPSQPPELTPPPETRTT